MRKQTTTTHFSHKAAWAGAVLILALSMLTFLLAPPWPTAAQEPTPTLPPATWATPVGGAQALPGETDWTLIIIIAVVVIIILVLLLLVFTFMLSGGKKPAPAVAAPRYQPPPPPPVYQPTPPRAAAPGDVQDTLVSAGARASLTVQAGPGAGQCFTLSKPETVIGRHSGNDVVIQDPEVSRRHASITRESGGFVLRDLGSNNGTFVNGQRLGGPQVLRNGDVIMLGQRVHLVFQTGG